MNWFGSSLITTYGIFAVIPEESLALLTEDNFEILTEDGNTILTE